MKWVFSKSKRLWAGTSALFLLLIAFAAWVLLQSQQVPIFSRAAAELPISFDPTAALSQVAGAVVNSVYDGLVEISDNGTITPGLATSWSETNHSTYTFILRRNVHFHDGTLLTPQIVLRSLERVFLSEAIPRAILPELQSIGVGNDSVTIKLTRPTNILPLLAAPTMRIALVTNQNFVGTGPYCAPTRTNVADFPAIVLVRNERYYQRSGGPKLLPGSSKCQVAAGLLKMPRAMPALMNFNALELKKRNGRTACENAITPAQADLSTRCGVSRDIAQYTRMQP